MALLLGAVGGLDTSANADMTEAKIIALKQHARISKPGRIFMRTELAVFRLEATLFCSLASIRSGSPNSA